MSISDKLTTIAENEQKVYEAGKMALVNSIDGLYRFFSNGTATGQNMELLPYVLKRDWQGETVNMQYTFQGNGKIVEFTFPETIRTAFPHGMFDGCTNLKNVSGFDKVFIGTVLTDLFNGCTSLEDCGTIPFSGVTFGVRTFQGCTALKEIRAKGEIIYSFDFGSCGNLSKASIESIIGALKSDKTGLTITFNKTAINSAFGINIDDTSTYTEEWITLRNSKSNWTFNYS